MKYKQHSVTSWTRNTKNMYYIISGVIPFCVGILHTTVKLEAKTKRRLTILLYWYMNVSHESVYISIHDESVPILQTDESNTAHLIFLLHSGSTMPFSYATNNAKPCWDLPDPLQYARKAQTRLCWRCWYSTLSCIKTFLPHLYFAMQPCRQTRHRCPVELCTNTAAAFMASWPRHPHCPVYFNLAC